MSIIFFTLAAESQPEKQDLRELVGEAKGFVRFSEGSGRYSQSSIHFGEATGYNCVFSGPRKSEVKTRLMSGANIKILCDFDSAFYQPSLVYEVSVDGEVVVGYAETSAFRRKWRGFGIAGSVAILALARWYLEKARKYGADAA